MAQNIYDDEGFFQNYAALPRSQAGLAAAPEWPALQAMLPPLRGLRVLDLGCGYGWFCRWAAGEGASAVVGVDLSERMLARAVEFGVPLRVAYERADLEHLDLGGRSFDVVYSSLTLHYVEDLARLVGTVRRTLPAGGSFVFSVEHPVFTAPTNPAFVTTAGGGAAWPLDGYAAEGPRVTNWMADGVVKHHRRLDTYVRLLRDGGFSIADLEEWTPSAADLAVHPEWADEVHRPAFLLVGAKAE